MTGFIFDLDGTLWDSRQAVANARNAVVKKLGLGLATFTAHDVQGGMGLAMDAVYRRAFPSIPAEQYPELRKHLDQEIMSRVLAGEATLFPGVDETLRTLASHAEIFLVSNCSTKYLQAYFDWSGHRELFRDALCNGDNRLPKAENIRLIVARNDIENPIYVGDTSGDHQAAKEAGSEYIHADYGFGEPDGECRKISSITELLLR